MSDNYPEDFDKYGAGIEELPEEQEPEEGIISEDGEIIN